MKNQLLLLLTTILSLSCYSQISFEKGYFIDNTDKKVSCFIKNVDWRINPIEFDYKLSENGESKKATIVLVKEFGIYNESKYIRSTVNIDTSREAINKLSNERNPVFVEKELFLKVLVEGKFNLYEYQNKDLRYFYNGENSTIEQLVYKSYITNIDKIAKNNRYKQQLKDHLTCSEFKTNRINSVGYNKKDLVRFFDDYSKCHNTGLIDFETKEKQDLFNLTIRPRLNSSSLKVTENNSNDIIKFDNKTGFGFGLEAEFIMNFNKNKWAVLIEPTYQNFKSEKTFDNTNVLGWSILSTINHSSLELPIGIRHYFFLNKNSKIFINGSFILTLGLKSTFEATYLIPDNTFRNPRKTDKNTSNFGFGIGYKFHDKVSLEIRHQTSREILSGLYPWSSDYRTLSIIFGYTLF